MSGLSSSCQRAQPQWETCELDQEEVGHELVGVGDGEQVKVGDGHGWTWCNARSGPPSLALGKLFLLCFFARREQQRH